MHDQQTFFSGLATLIISSCVAPIGSLGQNTDGGERDGGSEERDGESNGAPLPLDTHPTLTAVGEKLIVRDDLIHYQGNIDVGHIGWKNEEVSMPEKVNSLNAQFQGEIDTTRCQAPEDGRAVLLADTTLSNSTAMADGSYLYGGEANTANDITLTPKCQESSAKGDSLLRVYNAESGGNITLYTHTGPSLLDPETSPFLDG